MGRSMKGPTVHLTARSTNQLNSAGEHLLCSSSREGEQEDPLWVYARFNEMSDAINKCSCFPGAGSGNDEQRSTSKSGGGELFLVQLLGEVP